MPLPELPDTLDKDLRALALEVMPPTPQGVYDAFHALERETRPSMGGSDALNRALRAARTRLLARFKQDL